ncbi:hypothetical protein ASPZODRAFT_89357 [Penicilliopsis zonata CBS 506.65]|uniref:Acyl-CoA thioesterase II n=1 Tax=Penicilliopsis zonata CBS 506.65 TaxID=1073090 RepID=A0A1L9SRK4_9EURO|nr:hypothetical protein ASPZODRAFT_89357 [Penicilliopsis zonata CBS 506.65]OJJ49829.1 hypothetical protein ASPZODRAFT_89357 [Penicilliopsis zonata CBS 506.65]
MSSDEPHRSNGLITPSPAAFAELMSLERLDDVEVSMDPDSHNHVKEKIEIFRSKAMPYPPGNGGRAFGGHVYAQAAYAASKTVERGLVINDMTGSFILPGRLDVPYIFTVRHLRDGAMYCIRAVDARQEGKICFSCLCSFKRDEKQQHFDHQPPPVQQRYKSLLQGKAPEDCMVSPSIDVDWWINQVHTGEIEEPIFPGLDVRKVDMGDYNQSQEVRQHPEEYRQLTYYRLKGSPADSISSDTDLESIKTKDQSGEYDNLYACAHMYSSDKNSLLLIPRALGQTRWTAMASLTLTVIFHQHGEALRMIDWNATSSQENREFPHKWFIQEGWTPRSGENRAVHESWLWSPDGTLIATTIQDSLLRFGESERKEKL